MCVKPSVSLDSQTSRKIVSRLDFIPPENTFLNQVQVFYIFTSFVSLIWHVTSETAYKHRDTLLLLHDQRHQATLRFASISKGRTLHLSLIQCTADFDLCIWPVTEEQRAANMQCPESRFSFSISLKNTGWELNHLSCSRPWLLLMGSTSGSDDKAGPRFSTGSCEAQCFILSSELCSTESEQIWAAGACEFTTRCDDGEPVTFHLLLPSSFFLKHSCSFVELPA